MSRRRFGSARRRTPGSTSALESVNICRARGSWVTESGAVQQARITSTLVAAGDRRGGEGGDAGADRGRGDVRSGQGSTHRDVRPRPRPGGGRQVQAVGPFPHDQITLLGGRQGRPGHGRGVGDDQLVGAGQLNGRGCRLGRGRSGAEGHHQDRRGEAGQQHTEELRSRSARIMAPRRRRPVWPSAPPLGPPGGPGPGTGTIAVTVTLGVRQVTVECRKSLWGKSFGPESGAQRAQSGQPRPAPTAGIGRCRSGAVHAAAPPMHEPPTCGSLPARHGSVNRRSSQQRRPERFTRAVHPAAVRSPQRDPARRESR